MKNLTTLKSNLAIGECGEYFCDYDNGYICDVISDIADNQVDIYNYDLWEWAKDNESYIEDAIGEYGIDTKNFDLMQLFRQGQYYANTQDLYENLDDSIRNFIYNYLEHELDMDEISDELEYYIDTMCCNIDNNLMLEDLIEEITDFMNNDEE